MTYHAVFWKSLYVEHKGRCITPTPAHSGAEEQCICLQFYLTYENDPATHFKMNKFCGKNTVSQCLNSASFVYQIQAHKKYCCKHHIKPYTFTTLCSRHLFISVTLAGWRTERIGLT
jgi:hypothetical protein